MAAFRLPGKINRKQKTKAGGRFEEEPSRFSRFDARIRARGRARAAAGGRAQTLPAYRMASAAMQCHLRRPQCRR